MRCVVKICRKAIAFFDKHADSDATEAFDDMLGEIMSCLRVLTMIGDHHCMVADAFDGHIAKRTKVDLAALIYREHLALRSNSAKWELHAEQVARFEATVTHAAQIQQYIENFEGKDFQDAVEEALFLQQVVKRMPASLASARRSSLRRSSRSASATSSPPSMTSRIIAWLRPWLLGGLSWRALRRFSRP